MIRRPPRSTLFPTRRSSDLWESIRQVNQWISGPVTEPVSVPVGCSVFPRELQRPSRRWVEKRFTEDRKSTRLNSSHDQISYAVFCLKKKKISVLRALLQPKR